MVSFLVKMNIQPDTTAVPMSYASSAENFVGKTRSIAKDVNSYG